MKANEQLLRLFLSNTTDRQLLANFLRDLGYIVDDSLFLKKDESQTISAIITDENYAKKFKNEFNTIKQHANPAFLPLIICLPAKSDSAYSLSQGFDETFHFPINKSELISRLHTLLRLREQTESQFRLIYDTIHIGIYRMSETCMIIQANPAFLHILGFHSLTQIINMHFANLGFTPEKDWTMQLQKAKENNNIIEYETTYLRPDGNLLHLRGNVIYSQQKNGQDAFFTGTIEDISERKKIEYALKNSEEKFHQLIELSPYGILIYYRKKILFANKTACKILQAKQVNELIDTCLTNYIPNDKQPFVLEKIQSAQNDLVSTPFFQEKLITLHKKLIPTEILITPFVHDNKIAAQIIINDISERVRNERKISYLAYHDQLTGLYNRTKLEEELEKSILPHRKRPSNFTVILADIDDFKKINDTFGHHTGDLLLKELAKRLKKYTPKRAILARIGGDEFVIFLRNHVKSRDDAAILAQEILNQINIPFALHHAKFYITASIGISLSPYGGTNSVSLLKNADIAMYMAKRNGGNRYQFCTRALTIEANEKTYLEIELREAMLNNELFLHYQPKVSLLDGKITGVEALLRWHHPQKGNITPATFIPLAEASGLIVPITHQVIHLVCHQILIWQQAGLPRFAVAINLSLRHFREENFEKEIYHILKEYEIDPTLIEFEITESTLMHDVKRTQSALDYFKKRGIHIAIDDFGTGYSSLNYLKNLHCHSLKIDYSFVRSITPEKTDNAIILSIIEMAHSMNMVVIAEGVETEFQYHFLKMHHCDQIQGFLFSKPLPADELITFFKTHQS